jgi:hypothetical protein
MFIPEHWQAKTHGQSYSSLLGIQDFVRSRSTFLENPESSGCSSAATKGSTSGASSYDLGKLSAHGFLFFRFWAKQRQAEHIVIGAHDFRNKTTRESISITILLFLGNTAARQSISVSSFCFYKTATGRAHWVLFDFKRNRDKQSISISVFHSLGKRQQGRAHRSVIILF